MGPGARKVALTVHVVCSVGWLGAVAAFLAMAIAGPTTEDTRVVRGAYLMMDVLIWRVIVPLCGASLATGLVSSLGTPWGLFRHHWVLAKLFLNVFATVILLLYTQTVGYLAGVAASPTWAPADVALLQSPTAVLHACGALVLLLVAATLAVFKPQGLTRYGARRLLERRTPQAGESD